MIEKMQNFRIEFGPSSKDILHFTNQLSVMVRAGISLQDSLDSIASQQKNRKFMIILYELKSKIESGQSLSQALSEYPDVFSNIYVNMVAAAEISGSLSQMLQKLAAYLGEEAETKSQVKGAMVYPGIIAFMAISVTIFLLVLCSAKIRHDIPGKRTHSPYPYQNPFGKQ